MTWARPDFVNIAVVTSNVNKNIPYELISIYSKRLIPSYEISLLLIYSR